MVAANPRPFVRLPFDSLPDVPRLPHAYARAEQLEVVVRSAHFGDVRTHVRRLGAGPPLVLVHGLMTSSYSFRYVMAPLAERFTTWAFDLPGAGRSDKPDVPYTPDAMADFIGDFLRATGLEGAAVVANSMGGYLAMRLAMRRPHAMSRLLNVHAPGLPTARNHALSAVLAIPGTRRLLDALVRREPERWVHRNVHYYDETLKSLEEAREYGAPLATPEGRQAFWRCLHDTLRARDMGRFERALRALDGRFPIPLCLLYVPRDPMVPPSVGARLRALLPEAQWIELPEASHFAHVDAAERFLAVTAPFLAGSP